MVNEEIAGGIESALIRGQSMKKAMMSFYNAGYKKKDIEEAARFVSQNIPMPVQNTQNVSQTKKINSSEKPKSQDSHYQKNIPSKTSLIKHFEAKTLQPHEKSFLKKHKKDIPKEQKQISKKPSKQYVSSYGDYKDKEISQLKRMLIKTMKSLKQTRGSTQKTKIIYERQPPRYSQNVSGYGGPQTSKPAGKAIIILLVILLVILLGALGTLFFFKTEVIEFFNRFGIS